MNIGKHLAGRNIMQPEEFFATQRAYGTLSFPTHGTPLLHRSRYDGSIESKKMTTIDESLAEGADIQSRIWHVNGVLYLYGTPPLILFCVISVAINIKVLVSVFWIKRPLSPTLHISLSLAGADAFSSTALGVGLIMNSFIPYGLGIELKGVGCFLLALEAVRLGGVIITVFHLMTLAINHYLGILRPLHYLSIMTYRNTTFLLVLLWVLPISFFALYFSLIENEGFQSAGCAKNAFLYHKQFRILFSSLFFGPFALMVYIYVHIFCIVKKHQATRQRFRRAGSSFRPRASEALRSTSRQMAKNVKAVHTTLFILGSFVIGWMPGVIMYMLVCEDCALQFNWLSGHSTFFVYTIINCLIILKTLVNPIIYAARMHEIKAASRRMRNSFCGWVTSVTGITTNQSVNRAHSSKKTRSRHSQASRNGTCRSSHNVSVRRTRNGSTYTCTVCHIRGECDNTLV